MKDKKYQVFVSSTFIDLQEERRKVLDVLLMADCIPAGMEIFVATDDEQFEVIKKVINLCDYYILIIGQRYGSVNEATGRSYTEMEYEYAKEMGVPVLVFALDDSVDLPLEKKETDESKLVKLNNFRNLAMQNRLASIWKTSDDLTGKVAISIMKAKNEIIRPGWQRGNDFDEASLRREIMEQQKEIAHLQSALSNAESEIMMLTTNSDVAFDDCIFEFSVKRWIGNSQYRTEKKTFTLPELFKVVAIEMESTPVSEISLEIAIRKQLMGEDWHFNDEQAVKRVLIQLKALNLVRSQLSKTIKGGMGVFWSLTSKGIKTRNDMILLKNDVINDEE